jgi:hypothetical protein
MDAVGLSTFEEPDSDLNSDDLYVGARKVLDRAVNDASINEPKIQSNVGNFRGLTFWKELNS